MYKLKLIAFLLLCSGGLLAQNTLTGVFTQHANAEARLKGFNGFTEQVFSQDTLSSTGNFTLNYPSTYNGISIVELKGAGSLLVITNQENIQLKGSAIQDYAALKISQSSENAFLDSYIQQQGVRNNKVEALKFLKPLYQQDSLQSVKALQFINTEILKIEKEGTAFFKTIPKNKYASYYIPLRKLIEDRPVSVARYPERIPQHIAAFENYNLADEKLWQSGLMQEFYDGHFIMLENVYGVSNYQPMYKSIDYMISNLSTNEEKLLTVAEHLFKLFEKRSLYPAAEYLSIKMLDQNSCTVEGELERRFQQYKTMKPGNVAPNIVFEPSAENSLKGFSENEKSLKDIKSTYKLVVFWATWCEHCMQEIPKLAAYYPTLQEKDVAVVAIALDVNKNAYNTAIEHHKWYSFSDFMKWDGNAVRDYYVFATPSFYLLDSEDRIIRKINSVDHLEAVIGIL